MRLWWEDYLTLPDERPDTIAERDWTVIRLRKDGKTFDQIGDQLGVSRARVRQLEARAVRKLTGRSRYTAGYLP